MNSWPYVKLADVTTKVGSGATPRGGKASYKESGIPLIRSMNVHFDGFKYDGLAYLDDAQARALDAVEVRANDVLLNITGASIGRVTVTPTRMDGARVNQHVCIIRPKPELHPSFLRWYLASPGQQKLIMDVQSGATRQALTKEKILNLDVPAPPLSTQHQVVEEIDKQFSRLDEAVASLNRVKANLKRYRAAVLKAAVEGRLVPTEAELARREGRTYETGEQLLARYLKEHRAVRDEQVARGCKTKCVETIRPGNSSLPKLPEGWVWVSTEQVCSGVRDGTHNTPAYVTKGVPLVTSKNLAETGIDFENVKLISEIDHSEISRRSAVAPGDVLFAMIGTIGNPCVVTPSIPFSIKNVGLFKRSPETVLPQFLCHWLTSAPFDGWLRPRLKGTTQKFAPLGLLRVIPLPLPPISEQRRIATEVERRLSVVRNIENQVRENLGRASRVRQQVLTRAFSGKKV